MDVPDRQGGKWKLFPKWLAELENLMAEVIMGDTFTGKKRFFGFGRKDDRRTDCC